jgi:hypothetical protein
LESGQIAEDVHGSFKLTLGHSDNLGFKSSAKVDPPRPEMVANDVFSYFNLMEEKRDTNPPELEL